MKEGLAWLSIVAVLVASALPAPVAAALVESEPAGVPAALPAAPQTPSIPGLSGLPELPAAAQIGQAGAELPPLPAPAAHASPEGVRDGSLPLAAPAAHASPEGARDGSLPLAAAASLSRLGQPAGPQGSPSPKAAQAAVYDGAAKTQPSGESAVSAGDYTAAAPELPLARLTPNWSQAQAPRGERLASRGAPETRTVIGTEEELSAGDELRSSSADGALSRESRPEEPSYFELSAFTAKTGVKQAALVGSTLLWLDESGTLYGQDIERRKTMKFESPMGAADSFAVGGDGNLYVSAGGHLQRWNLETGKAAVFLDERLSTSGGARLIPTAKGVEVVSASAHFAVENREVSLISGGESFAEPATGLRSAGPSAYWSVEGQASRAWIAQGSALSDMGALPVAAEAAAATPDGKTLYAAADGALYEWELGTGKYRRIELPGLADAGVGRGVSVGVNADGTVLVAAADKVFLVNPRKRSQELDSKEGQARLWSEQNPMYVRDGFLHIGEFQFPIEAPKAPADARSGLRKLFDRLLGRPGPRAAERGPLVSERDWQALNLPTNKWALYQTLKSFSLGQHVLYIGETGGGKTWMASMVAKITGNDLWMVSLTEYTRNQDLIARDTFGEEGANKTGLSMSVVLKWLQNGGVLLLDEMHKPLEGIASLNNILQNLEYRMPDGRVIKGDPKKCFVIGTMNPVKPPYRGEPPSGELESRFGAKLSINYLPPAEEAALLSIFHPATSQRMARALVSVANDLRKVYPDVLPLPISSRTLRHIVERMEKYPTDDPVEIFKIAFNPTAIVDDPSIGHAIDKALQAHDLRSAKAASAQGDSSKN